MKRLRRVIRKLLGRDNPDAVLDREIAYHVETLIEAHIAQGMAPVEARRQALLEFGGREQVKQKVREVHLSAFGEAVASNLKAAVRFLRKSPTFSLAVILTLALGIGANSAVFSAIDTIILRPLPFPEGDQLVALYQHDSKGRDANRFVAPARLEDWNRMNSTFQAISGSYTSTMLRLWAAYCQGSRTATSNPRARSGESSLMPGKRA
jgi:putative ABC transport system permease protein